MVYWTPDKKSRAASGHTAAWRSRSWPQRAPLSSTSERTLATASQLTDHRRPGRAVRDPASTRSRCPTRRTSRARPAMVYEPLMQYNLLKAGQIYPWLATSWSWADGGTELVLHTRTGVKWSDGKPFSAADVAYTFNLMKRFPALDVNGVTFTSASAPSSTEAIVKFADARLHPAVRHQPGADRPPAHLGDISNPVTYVDDNPVGTGPYRVSRSLRRSSPSSATRTTGRPGFRRSPRSHFLSYASNPSAGLAIGSGTIDWNTVFMPNYQDGLRRQGPVTSTSSRSRRSATSTCARTSPSTRSTS